MHGRSVVLDRVSVDSSSMTSSPQSRPTLILRAGALAGGYTDGEIRRRRARGIWTSAMRGAYFMTAELPQLKPAERHRIFLETLRPRIAGDPVVSHVSAAVLHGLPLWRVHLGQVHVTRQPPATSHRGSQLHAHAAVLDADEVVELGDWAVTSIARTIVDLGRTLPFEQALVAADFALHCRLISAEDLATQMDRCRRLPGALAASRVVSFADGRSESPGESRSRIMIHRAGLPEPDLQMTVLDDQDKFLARADFGFRKQRVVGEFDGKQKYTELLGPHEDPREVVFREKLREDAVRDAGWSVVRWVWTDLDNPADAIARLQRALRRGGN